MTRQYLASLALAVALAAAGVAVGTAIILDRALDTVTPNLRRNL